MKNILFGLSIIIAISFASCGDKNGNSGSGSGSDLPRISIDNVTQFEGDGDTSFDFVIRLSSASNEKVSVDYTTESGTAAAENDFVSKSGTINFEPSVITQSITIDLVTDTLQESNEEFRIVLSNPVNATLSTEFAIGTIRNDDTYVFVPEDGFITPESYDGWDLVWADEFSGSTINTDNWTHELGNHGWGNNEWQNYTNSSENSYISDGKLVIEAKEQNGSYTSARMITAGKQEFMFGRVDIRAKLPYGQGVWPALWMLGSNFYDIGWPACGEIDIMELLGHEPEIVHGTVHWGNPGEFPSRSASNEYTLSDGKNFSDEFHVFSMIWDFDSVRLLVDNQQYFTANPNTTQGWEYPYNADFFFLFNVAVGGNWPGYPDATTQFPQRMFVDYIRVFQKQ